jgi:hypothetical protein
MPDEQAKPKRVVQINNTRMQMAEYWRNEWVVNAELGTTVEDVMDPQYWAHMAAMLKPYDRIEVRVDDGSWLLELIVTGCDRSWAKVHLLQRYELTTADVAQTQSAKYEVAWKGPQHKWVVIRLSDQMMIKSELGSKNIAYTWMLDFEKSAAAQ